jgi:hypothetical protein
VSGIDKSPNVTDGKSAGPREVRGTQGHRRRRHLIKRHLISQRLDALMWTPDSSRSTAMPARVPRTNVRGD